jgi:peptidylprolyl isomerase
MPVKKGDKVKLDYSGKLKDGRVFATTEGKDPLEFEAGAGEILSGIDDAVVGMEKNEQKEIILSPEEGFGKRKEELVVGVPKHKFGNERVEVGQRVSVQTKSGRVARARVTQVGDDQITLDLNHPLAGKQTIFNIKVVEIEKK